ncbi:MAG: dCTP deaminase [Candidatus Micrarchaeia archaeon]
MILSDFDIMNMVKSGRMSIKPFAKDIIRENGADFRLANEIARHVAPEKDFVLDPTDKKAVENSYKIEKNKKELIINSHEQVLLSTYETISMPDDVAGFVELRSTWARHGLSMPPTVIDAGFKGTVTLEVFNNAPYGIKLKPGLGFAHIIFIKTSSKVASAYSGIYQNQNGIHLPKVISKPKH